MSQSHEKSWSDAGAPEAGHHSMVVGRVLVFAMTVIAAAPVIFVLAGLGLVVEAVVIFPVAILATGAVASLIAAWLATWLAGDGRGTAVSAVAWRSLLWAAVPAAGSPLLALFPGPLVIPMALILAYLSLVATLLAFQHRTTGSVGGQLGLTAGWLIGVAVTVALVIRAASLVGLTGA